MESGFNAVNLFSEIRTGGFSLFLFFFFPFNSIDLKYLIMREDRRLGAISVNCCRGIGDEDTHRS